MPSHSEVKKEGISGLSVSIEVLLAEFDA